MPRRPSRPPQRRIGVEHEYAVANRDGPVDFRSVIHELSVPGWRIDPGDIHAYRLPSGLKITCDGPEAEIATPPIDMAAGAVSDMVSWTHAGWLALRTVTHDEFRLTGVSTHISVSVDNDLARTAAGLFSRTFASPLMLLMDRSDSPGLLIRPRHGRLEFAGEFATDEHLVAATALAAGGSIVCERAAQSYWARSQLPPPIRTAVAPAVDRYGWYVDRTAFGVDLYREGRHTTLRRELVGRISAQRHLAAAWSSARRALGNLLDTGERDVVDRLVSGADALPVESSHRPSAPRGRASVAPGGIGPRVVTAGDLELVPVAATWDFVVFAPRDHRAFVSVPTAELGRLEDRLRTGSLATEISTMRRAADGPELVRHTDALALAVWKRCRITSALAPPERGPDGVEIAPRADSITGSAILG